MTSSDPLLAVQFAHRNRTARNYTYLAGIVLGLVAGCVWLVAFPELGPKQPQYKVFGGFLVGLVCASLVVLIAPRSLFPAFAACPDCGESWEIREGRSVRHEDQMTSWKECPGCKAAMPLRARRPG